jgi:hypothetical protein
MPAWHLSAKVGVPADFVGPVLPGPAGLQLLRGRTPPPKPVSKHMTKFLVIAMCIGALMGGVATRRFFPVELKAGQVASGERVYSDKVKGVGYVHLPNKHFLVTLSDGRQLEPLNMSLDTGGAWQAEVTRGEWVKGVQ